MELLKSHGCVVLATHPRGRPLHPSLGILVQQRPANGCVRPETQQGRQLGAGPQHLVLGATEVCHRVGPAPVAGGQLHLVREGAAAGTLCGPLGSSAAQVGAGPEASRWIGPTVLEVEPLCQHRRQWASHLPEASQCNPPPKRGPWYYITLCWSEGPKGGS